MSLTGAGPVDRIEPSARGFSCDPPRESIPATGAVVHSIGRPSLASVRRSQSFWAASVGASSRSSRGFRASMRAFRSASLGAWSGFGTGIDGRGLPYAESRSLMLLKNA